jgi:predicted AAA+ superfamily ATPase
MHPFSVAETACPDLPDPHAVIRQPTRIPDADFQALWEHGGFPEPFLKRDARFTRRWAGLRLQQLLREELRDVTRIHELAQLEVLAQLLLTRSATQLNYSSLAADVCVAVDTIRRWLDILCGLHFGFIVRPWYRNVANSLRKEPKWFLRDWSDVQEPGRRAETLVACHLLKAVEGWTDLGLGAFELGYLRDKAKREVDFIVARDHQPWFLVEVKQADERISPALGHYQRQTGAPSAFQVTIEAAYVDADCFARPGPPLLVPARTFLSQLL